MRVRKTPDKKVGPAILKGFVAVPSNPATPPEPGLIISGKPAEKDKSSTLKVRVDSFAGNQRFLSDPSLVRHSLIGSSTEPFAPAEDFETILQLFWDEAEKTLRQEGKVARIWRESDLKRFEGREHSAKLTDAQKNALEVFRAVRHIQGLAFAHKPIYETSGAIKLDPVSFEGNLDGSYRFASHEERARFNELFNGALLLTSAAKNCDFFQYHWSRVERRIEDSLSDKAVSQAGVAGRRASARGRLLALKIAFCLNTWERYNSKGESKLAAWTWIVAQIKKDPLVIINGVTTLSASEREELGTEIKKQSNILTKSGFYNYLKPHKNPR